MKAVFSTEGVAGAEAFDYWRDIARANLLRDFESTAFDRENFYAGLKMGTLGDINVGAWRSAPVITRCNGADDLILVLPESRGMMERPAIRVRGDGLAGVAASSWR